MSFLRDIVTDLREKRLWPFAALLAIALVAVPVVLGRGGNPPAAAPIPLPAVPAAPATGTSASDRSHAVSLVAPSGRRHVSGHRHDPFGTPGGPAKAAAPAAPAAQGVGTSVRETINAFNGPAGGSGSGTSSGSSSSSSNSTTSSPPATPKTTPKPLGVAAGYSADLTFGPAGTTKSLRDVTRLTPLKTEVGPLGLLAGVRENPVRVVFLLAPGVSATGDGRCRPNPQHCQVLELRKDQSEFFDVATPTGVVQYELDIDRVAPRTEPTAAAARRTLRLESPAGRKLMTKLFAAGQTFLHDHYVYKPAQGLLESHLITRFVVG